MVQKPCKWNSVYNNKCEINTTIFYGVVDRIVVRTPTPNYRTSTITLRGPVWLLLLVLYYFIYFLANDCY